MALFPFLFLVLEGTGTFAFQTIPRATNGIVPQTQSYKSTFPTFQYGSCTTGTLRSSILGDEDRDDKVLGEPTIGPLVHYQDQESMNERKETTPIVKSFIDSLPFIELFRERRKMPPMQIDDTNLLLYDVFLIVNLTLSISFWVTYRMDFSFLPIAFSEGCLFSIFWILSGLYHGMFLYSAVDGHYGSADERGGPKAAATLALNTYINAVNLRLVFAFLEAVAEHRPAGMASGEQLLPLEIGFGLLLMSSWRALHSSITPRI